MLRELRIQDTDVVVVHAAVLKTIKRPLDIVCSALQALRRNPNLIYLIVGDGDLRREMIRECKTRSISHRFRFVGWIEYDLMPDYINVADMVEMPSKGEGLARVYLETQACARLLIASDISAAREVIVNGETGLLFRKGNIDDLTAKTLLAASNP